MAKHYIYTDRRKNSIIFETTQANHISMDTVDKMVLDRTGHDPRLDPGRIERQIRTVPDKF